MPHSGAQKLCFSLSFDARRAIFAFIDFAYSISKIRLATGNIVPVRIPVDTLVSAETSPATGGAGVAPTSPARASIANISVPPPSRLSHANARVPSHIIPTLIAADFPSPGKASTSGLVVILIIPLPSAHKEVETKIAGIVEENSGEKLRMISPEADKAFAITAVAL